MSRMLSFLVLLAVILLVGVLFFRVMASFFVPLFFAALLVVIFRPVHEYLLARCKGRQTLAAGLTTAAILLIVLLPAIGAVALAVVEGSSLVSRLDVVTVKNRLAKVRSRLELDTPLADDLRFIESALRRLYGEQAYGEQTLARGDVPQQADLLPDLLRRLDSLERSLRERRPDLSTEPLTEEILRLESETPGSILYQATVQVAMREFRELKLELLGGPLKAWMVDMANPSDEQIRAASAMIYAAGQDWLLSIGGATTAFVGKLLLGLLIMIVSVFFFLLDGPVMTQAVMRLSPLDDRYERELIHEFDSISRAVVVATLLSALAQGILAGFGYWLAGLDSLFLLIVLTALMAMVPFLGAAAIWLPVSLWLYFYEERTLAAVLLIVYGMLFVSMADNVIKPMVLHGRARLHPLLALLSVLGGVQALGPIGILVGPMVVAFLQTLLNILHRELSSMDKSFPVTLQTGP